MGGDITKLKVILFFILTLITAMAAGQEKLVIYTYDSLLPLANEAFQAFEEKENVEIELHAIGDAGSMLSRIISQKEELDVDIVIGIDNVLAQRAFEEELFIGYLPPNAEKITNTSLIFDPFWRLIPYDYGAIALIYDPESFDTFHVKSFNDLTREEFNQSIITQDPRTSSTGLAFLTWTYLLHEDDFGNFWKEFKDSILTITLGWGDAFEKFEAQEAPMMVSYATDKAYSMYNYNEAKYEVLIPGGKGYAQIEGAGIIRWSNRKEKAKKFIEYMLSDDFQKHISLTQWMFPVTNVELPKVFNYAVKPEEILKAPANLNIEALINEWEEAIY
ncbi:MAG: thiamine ABC transporter substrate-binding protein [Thermotogota bacterium]|nr:thiamine ABC transporter substrate-binding protein [Thermotogota bacterium]